MKKLLFLLAIAVSGVASQAGTFSPTTPNDFPVSGTGVSVNTATGVITGGAGSGLITLRSAVIAANANSGSTINIPAGTYTLTIAGDDGSVDPNPAIGDLDVTASIIIKGAGPDTTIIQAGTTSANGIDQIMTLNAFFTSRQQSAVINGYSATITGVTFRNGKCTSVDELSGSFVGGAISFDAGYNNGGAIASPGTLSISNCVFDSNSSQFGGSAIAIFDGGTITMDSCLFTNNGVAFSTSPNSVGGGIFYGNTPNSGTLTIKNSTLANNVANNGGAIGLEGGTPTCVIHNCVIANNSSVSEGGAISSVGSLTMDQGTIVIKNVSKGTGNGAAGGGAMLLSGGTVNISNCMIVSNMASLSSANQAGGGGILASAGAVTISNCRIFGNVASSGSGLLKDNNPGSATANNNWWGNNGGPGVGGADSAVKNAVGSGGGTMTLNNWLVMGFTASPTTILTNGTSTLTATIVKNSAGTSGFTVPDGTPVNFGATLGTDSPASAKTTSGTATSTFTAGSVGGLGSGSATIDAQMLSTNIIVDQPPAFTNVTSTTFTVGSVGAFTVGANGFPVPTLGTNAADVYPNGVSFNTSTGNLGGTPGPGTGGTYTLHFTANNGVGSVVSQTFTLTVDQGAAITSPNTATFVARSANTFTVTASGFPVPTLGRTGALPTGVSFNSGVLSGTPATGTGGIYPLTFSAHNGVGTDASQSFTLTVNELPTVNCPADVMTNSTGGDCLLPVISFAATSSGFPTPALKYNLNSVEITSPHAFAVGTNVVTVTATNTVGTNSCSFTVIVNAGAAPELAVATHGTNVVLSWPTNYSCYTLQFSPDLPGNDWSNFTGSLTTVGTNFVVTNSPSGSNTYFRLAK